MKRVVLVPLLFCCAVAFGQQSWQITQYMSNMYLVNSASAGEIQMLDLNLSYRQQWLGSQFAPRTVYISGTSRIFAPQLVNKSTLPTSSDYFNQNEKGKLKHAMGGIILQDQFGAFSYSQFGASYNMHVPLNRTWILSTALKGSFKNWVFDPSKVQTGIIDDPTLSQFTASNQPFNDWIPSLDFSLYAYSRSLFVSYTTDQLTQGELEFENTSTTPKLQMTHYGVFGGRIRLNQATHIVPSTLAKYTDGAPVSIDFNVKFDVQNRYFAAIGYRFNSDLLVTGAVFINNKLKVGYSLDYPLNKTRMIGLGSHELFLGLQLFKR